MQKFSRYLDVDGDGIAARTLPGVHPKGAYFTRGSGHNKLRRLHRGRRRVPGGAWTACARKFAARGDASCRSR